MWSILNFGKYADKMSLPEVVLHDPDWFFKAIESNRFEKRGFAAEARDLNFKARNIKIPRPATEHWCVYDDFDHRGKFCGFTLAQVAIGRRSISTAFGFISCSSTRAAGQKWQQAFAARFQNLLFRQSYEID
jgi:hypothetical protein